MWPRAACLAVLVAATVSLALSLRLQAAGLVLPLQWDEVDYVDAARLGLVANATSRGEVALLPFLHLARAKWAGLPAPSGLPDESRDPFQLRHFHPPLPVYYWSLVVGGEASGLGWRLRAANTVLSACAVLVVVACARWRHPAAVWGTFASLPALIGSDLFDRAFAMANFHAPFWIALVICSTALVRYVSAPSASRAAVAGMTAGLPFLTLETAPAALVFLLGTVAALCRPPLPPAHHSGIAAAGFATVMATLWPGIFVSGGPLKSWAMYLYRFVQARGAEYRDVRWHDVLGEMFASNAGLFLWLLAAAFLCRREFGRRRAELAIVLSGVLYVVAMTPVTLNPTYLFPGLGLISYGLGLSIGASRPFAIAALAWAAVAVQGAGLDVGERRAAADRAAAAWHRDAERLAAALEACGGPALVDGAHIMRLGLRAPTEQVAPLFVYDPHAPRFAVRRDYRYDFVEDEIRQGRFRPILVRKQRAYSASLGRRLEDWGFRATSLDESTLYVRPADCPALTATGRGGS